MLNLLSLTRRAARLGLIVLMALLMSATVILPADAATAPSIAASPAIGAPGAQISVFGAGLPARATTTLTWDGVSSGLPHPRVSRSGTFEATVQIPRTSGAGNHTLMVRAGAVSASMTIVVQVPPPAPTPTPSPVPTPAPTSAQVRVLQLVNGARSQAGLTPLVSNDALTSAAQSYAQLMASTNCFSHTCGSVPDFSQRITLAGYTNWRNLGENIAAGYPTPDEAFSGWMNSSGHRANILNPNFRDSGVGVANGGQYGIYWVQDFGSH